MSNPYIVMSDTHRDRNIQTHPLGCHSDILDRNLMILDAAVQSFRKAYFVRIDLRFPDDLVYPANNDLIRLFMETFRAERMANRHRLFYIWVWEQDSSINHHYHCCFIFDGNRTQNLYGHVAAAKEIWGRLLGVPHGQAPVWDCTRDRYGDPQVNGIMVNVNAPDYELQYARCYHWLSYLAKASTKESIPAGQRKMGSSVLPHLAGQVLMR
jgi:hypothetical protein